MNPAELNAARTPTDKSAGVLAVLSMLHEPSNRLSSASRLFRGEPVLAWTLKRLRACRNIAGAVVLCWEDQQAPATSVASGLGATCVAPSRRAPIPMLDAVAAARRWADGWRGGLLASCEFDRGFHAPFVAQALNDFGGEAVLLVDPAAGLVDPQWVDRMVDQAAAEPEIDFFFSQCAPGLTGALIRKSMLDRLAASNSHPGTLLAYRPDLAQRDPIVTPACVPVPTPLARTSHRFMLDSTRQIERIARATEHLNGQLIGTHGENLLRLLSTEKIWDRPREIVLELTPRRHTKPAWWPGTHRPIERPDASADLIRRLFEEIAGIDDLRLVLGGAGDPLLHAEIFDILGRAAAAGISATIETDLIGIENPVVDWLADSALDVICVQLPAAIARTYQSLMGVDGMKMVLDNLRRLIDRRQSRGSGTPLIVPTFTKTKLNLAEMEPWYDHWLRLLGCAVITGPSDYSQTVPDISSARMDPPLRRPCSRLAQRLTVLSDGTVVSCEQDLYARQSLGKIGQNTIEEIWTGPMAGLRADHESKNWEKHPLCAACSDWHRP